MHRDFELNRIDEMKIIIEQNRETSVGSLPLKRSYGYFLIHPLVTNF